MELLCEFDTHGGGGGGVVVLEVTQQLAVRDIQPGGRDPSEEPPDSRDDSRIMMEIRRSSATQKYLRAFETRGKPLIRREKLVFDY